MKRQAKIISIVVSEGDDGLYHVTSPQMESLFVTGETMEQAVDKVPESIEGLYALDGIKVCAVPADSQDLPIPDPWVIVENGSIEAAC